MRTVFVEDFDFVCHPQFAINGFVQVRQIGRNSACSLNHVDIPTGAVSFNVGY